MKISGFSFVKNGISLYYPVVESIKSILPIVDEFIIAVGEGSDDTREQIDDVHDYGPLCYRERCGRNALHRRLRS